MTMADKKEKNEGYASNGYVTNESDLKRYEDSKSHFMHREGTYTDNLKRGWDSSTNYEKSMKITTFVPKSGGSEEQWIEITVEYSEPKFEIQFVKQLDGTHYEAILKRTGMTDYTEVEYFAKGSKDVSFPSGRLKLSRVVPNNE